MSSLAATPEPAAADATFDVWRTYTRRLVVISLVSIALAWPLAMMNRTVDGRDPFYVAMAWQFAVWGVIDLLFALSGLRGLRRTARLDPAERDAELSSQREKILNALRFNRWLNAVWLAIAIALLARGYRVWSPSLVGHGVGMFVQAIALVIYDRAFARALRETALS